MNKSNTSIIVIALLIIGSLANNSLHAAHDQTILERVRKVENPELAKLIQIAINNLPESRRLKMKGNAKEQVNQFKYELDVAKLKAVRIVTEKYSQIKLLDKKIEQIEKKFGITNSSPDISLEIEIAKATLESTRMTYIAELREGLGMIPWYPFGPKEIHELNTWLHLELLGDGTTIRILNFYKSFGSLSSERSKNYIMCPPAQAVQHIEELLKQSNVLPIRITFGEMETASDKTEDFVNKIKAMLQNSNADYGTELLKKRYVIKGRTVYEHTGPSRKSSRVPRASNIVPWSVDKLASEIKVLLQRPFSLPLTINYTNYDTNPEKGIEIEAALNKMVDELNLKDWITIKNATPEPEKLQ